MAQNPSGIAFEAQGRAVLEECAGTSWQTISRSF
jgi:hypothetical protein